MTKEEAILVLQKIKPIPCRADNKSITHAFQTVAIDMAIKALEQQKVGEWCKQNDDYFDWYECSECGYGSEGEMQYSSEYDVRTNYCPNCGAKMIEPQESEDKE